MLITKWCGYAIGGVIMRIGIFGGSFNPPHKMHVNIANYMINKQYVDKVIFVPTGSKYAYKNNLVLEEHRYNMVEILTKKFVDITFRDKTVSEKQKEFSEHLYVDSNNGANTLASALFIETYLKSLAEHEISYEYIQVIRKVY